MFKEAHMVVVLSGAGPYPAFMARNPSEKSSSRGSQKVGTTVTKDNLKALGADRLADLLVELAG